MSGVAAREFVAPARLAATADLLRRASAEIESEITGTSMAATLPPGTQIRIRCGAVAPRANITILVFLLGTRVVSHRVVGRVGDHVITRGDGAVVCDPPVALADALGEVVAAQGAPGWQGVAAAPRMPLARRVAAALALAAVTLALMLDARLAHGLAMRLARWRRGPER